MCVLCIVGFFDSCLCVLVTCVVVSMCFVLFALDFYISIYPYLLLV